MKIKRIILIFALIVLFINLASSKANAALNYNMTVIPSSFIDISASPSSVNTGLFGDDVFVDITLPFAFNFYNQPHSLIRISSNGYLTFPPENGQAFNNVPIPTNFPPNNLIAPFWDDIIVSNNPPLFGSVYYNVHGAPPNQKLIIQWNDVIHYPFTPSGITFQAILSEADNSIEYHYWDLDFNDINYNNGASASVGVENQLGNVGVMYSFNTQSLNTFQGIRFVLLTTAPPNNPPVAVPGGPYSGFEGSSIQFNGLGSFDPDPGDFITSYEWDLDGNGQFETFGPIVSYIYPDDANVIVSLKVTDNNNASSTAITTVTVNNVAPNVNIASPINGDINFDGFVDVTLNASFSDPGLDTYTYAVDWDDGSIDTGSAVQGLLILNHQYHLSGTFEVNLQVTDDDLGVGISTTQAVITFLGSIDQLEGCSGILSNLIMPHFFTDVVNVTNFSQLSIPGGNFSCAPTSAGVIIEFFNRTFVPGFMNQSSLTDLINELRRLMGVTNTSGTTPINQYLALLNYTISHGFASNFTLVMYRNGSISAAINRSMLQIIIGRSPNATDFINEISNSSGVIVSIRHNTLNYSHAMAGHNANRNPNSDGTYNVSFMDPWGGNFTYTTMYPNGTIVYNNGTATMTGMRVLRPNNSPPNITVIKGNTTVIAGSKVNLTIIAFDSNNQTLTYFTNATFGSLNSTTGVFIWPTNSSNLGNHTITFFVSDGLTSASKTINITVLPNTPPNVTGVVGNTTIIAGGLVNFTIQAVNPNNLITLIFTTNFTFGSLNNLTGNFVWQTNTSNIGNHSIPINISNGFNSIIFVVNVTVLPVPNQPPVLQNPGNRTIAENQTLVIQLNATDPNNQTVIFGTNASSVLPSNFTFDSANGTFRWRPTFNDAGNYTVAFTASDGNLTVSQTIVITVLNVNLANLTIIGNATSSNSTGINIGGTVPFSLNDPTVQNKPYILAMALGTSPGIPLSDGRIIPLNGDFVFFLSVFNAPLIGLQNSQGMFNNQGQAISSWTVPQFAISGITVYLAFVTIDPNLPMPQSILSISNSVSVIIQ